MNIRNHPEFADMKRGYDNLTAEEKAKFRQHCLEKHPPNLHYYTNRIVDELEGRAPGAIGGPVALAVILIGGLILIALVTAFLSSQGLL